MKNHSFIFFCYNGFMKKIIITATAESIEQVEELLKANVDRIYVGEKNYGLRLPHNFSLDELNRISDLVHQAGKGLTVAVNALMHQEMMDKIKPYLDFLQEIGTDYITVGDAGVFYVLQRDGYKLKTIYDASTMVTSSRQINFWAKNAGVSEAVLAREIPSAELFKMPEILEIPAEVLVYGASVIHHSKRPLLQNYYNFTHIDDEKTRERDLFLAEPSDPQSHYSIFEDNHGTHIFANNDLDLMTKLIELVDHGFCHWKLEGLYTPGHNFVEIAKIFVEARDLIEAGKFSSDQAFVLDEAIHKLHPKNRFLDTGFYDYDPDMVK
ncbi:U32 family peptidase [Streptococcus sanguinis]|uniref:U32 family peptidase n=2 Tax=Streptococcus sanguinis TaxID=1305 RepID=A0AAJ5NLP1_STRSA|nr:putative protease YhbU precursor [Streptococcus sanguinis]VDY70890.1 U32 family peptidase [Streptococcus sanguinis]